MTVRLKITKPGPVTPRGWLAFIVLCLAIAGGVMRAQLQQSGGPGSTVTANAGTNLNTSLLALESGGNIALIKAKTDNLDVALSTRLKPADTLTGVTTLTTVTNPVNVIPKTACGNTLATGSTLAAMPTSSTLVTSAATACATAVFFSNTNSGTGTVTLTDNTGTPINAVLTFTIPGNSNMILPLYGVAFNLGIKWAASGTGFTGAVVSYQ